MRGTINRADRFQRILAGGALIVLNAIGLVDSPDRTRWFALFVQIELLGTGLTGAFLLVSRAIGAARRVAG